MTDIEENFVKLKRLVELFTNFISNTTKTRAEAAFTESDCSGRMQLLESYWSKFTSLDDAVASFSDKMKDRTYFKDDLYGLALSEYLNAKSWLRDKLKKLQPSVSLQTNTPSSDPSMRSVQSQLEKVKLPRFNGKQRSWQTFKEKFKSLILDDKTIPNVIKFQHLLNSLEGDAADKLKGIQVIAANFETAWETLCRRYDNPSLRFSTHMNALSSLPKADKESATHLNQLLNTANESINAFKALSLPVDKWDAVIIYFLESKLPVTTRFDWTKEIERTREDPAAFPKFAELKTFLEERIRTLDLVDEGADCAEQKHNNDADHRKNTNSNKQRRSVLSVTSGKNGNSRKSDKCSFCSGEHFVGYCKTFANCSQAKRREHVTTARLCFNCLSPSHTADKCTSKGRCFVCNDKHHTKLHLERTTNVQPASSNEVKTVAATSSRDAQRTATSRGVILATACVLLEAENGTTITARALLDPCAEECIITEHVAQTLSLKRRTVDVAVCGVGGSVTVAKHRISVRLKSSRDPNFSLDVSALTLRRLSAVIPRTEIPWRDWPHLQGLDLADPGFGTPGRIDCILHAGVYAAVMRPEFRRIADPCSPLAMLSVFGWVVIGHAGDTPVTAREPAKAFSITADLDLSESISRFWETEEVPQSAASYSPAEQECFQHFKDTHARDSEGRFVVRLPFISHPKLSNTEESSMRSFLRLEKRFRKSPTLATAYGSFINEYLSLDHLEVVPENEVKSSSVCVLSHHPVYKNDGTGRIRVVFHPDKDEKHSLNSFLHAGPKLQEDVLVIITRWRFHRFAFSCDIVKMFRQFRVHPDDVNWQRIFWRFQEDEPVKTLRLLTVTYGTTCAPFLANACLLQLADDEAGRFPQGARILRQNRYVDDSFAGGDTLSEALETRSQVIDILASAGMQVGKWAANHSSLLQGLRSDVNTTTEKVFQETDSVSTLGLRWNQVGDTFFFKVSVSDSSETITKKTILSEIAKLYDPAGWLAPVIIRAKIFMQNLWLTGVGWDEALPLSLRTHWLAFRTGLPEVESIFIPRWFGTVGTGSWSLHGFCDASERAYAASIYIVYRSENSVISSRLIAAKTKVAPIKTLSIPRLELCGAMLLAKLVSYFLTKLTSHPTKIFCWTDSQVVLAWLRSHPSRWKSFVANRVTEIITMLPQAVWRHVRSQDNPADVASRGCSPAELRESSLWWSGPAWLKSDEANWPLPTTSAVDTEIESRNSTLNSDIFLTLKSTDWLPWLEKFSSFDKLMRILAYIHRWRNNAKLPAQERKHDYLSALELAAGRTYLIRLVQGESFMRELSDLSSKGRVTASSPLCRLTPFLDEDGVIRVGGRLQNSFLTEPEKHPIILPGKHHVTNLLVRAAHRVTLHGGPLLVQSFVYRQYWILRGRNLIRGIVRRCVKCTRYNANTQEQLMGALPATRTRPARPFTYTGLDYAGPFYIKASSGRGRKTFKGYVAIFVCLVIKAIHLEVVSDLTTAAFLAAFKRFVARRGLCHTLYSDNATNFHGADAELRRLFAETSSLSQEVAAAIATHGVKWSFIPPRAPNFGGLWEANVRSFKRHLQRVVGETMLTYEEFSTVTSQIEACLNSRPLSSLSSNEEDVSALTPGHFLIGAALVSPPEPFIEINETNTVCSRWHLLIRMQNHFWKRWSREFLTQAQQRVKWHRPNNLLQKGDLVLFKDELLPPTRWPLARITALHPGADGLARVATIRTATTEYKRPVNRLILLPISEKASTIHRTTEDEAAMAGGSS